MTNYYNLFKFLEDKKGIKVPYPLKLKLLYAPEALTKDDLYVKGGLNLSNLKITSLPDNLTVTGELNLTDSKITVLPKNLTVGTLRLSFTDIKTLPEDLKVSKLFISRTDISELPSGLSTKFKTLVLYNSDINVIPDNLDVGTLAINDYQIQKVPSNLNVSKQLYISRRGSQRESTQQYKEKLAQEIVAKGGNVNIEQIVVFGY